MLLLLWFFSKLFVAYEMLKSIRNTLISKRKFSLTLIVLDEVQQYIREDSQRSIEVQEAVESCCKNIGGKLLFIGTGQKDQDNIS